MIMEGLKWNTSKYEKSHVHPGRNTDNNSVNQTQTPNILMLKAGWALS